LVAAMVRGYSVLVLAIVASVVAGRPQTNDISSTSGGAAPTEEVITCECVKQINDEVMPDVNLAINALTNSVDELFKLANATEISPTSVRFFCLFCRRIRRYRKRFHGGHFNNHHYHHHRPQHHHQSHHHGHYHGKREALGPVANAVCPINEVVAQAQTAREGTQIVQEVIAGIRADPKEVNQDLLDDVTALYNEVNESVKNIQKAVDPNSSECKEEKYVPDVLFPGEG
ncbi:unnamed protein product, partial [Meganyctiphanes norvegica]